MRDEELIRQLRKVGTTNGHDNSIVAIAADRIEALTAALPHMADTPCDHICMGECATDDCENCGIHHFEVGGVGSYYCGSCLKKIAALASHEPAPEPEKDGPEVVDYLACGSCQGSGYGGHPDSGVLCGECNGRGGLPLIRLSDYEALRAERDAALEAEDEAKDCFWAIYPDWVEMKGHGINVEAARTMLADQIAALRAENERLRKHLDERLIVERALRRRAENAEARNAELVKALEPFANAKITYLDAPDGREVKAKHVHGLVYGDFRRARTAFKGQSNEA